jgi:hypothetical protein
MARVPDSPRQLFQPEDMNMLVSDNGGGGTFEQAPVGAHVARCIKLIDIGTHHGEYEGVPNVRHQIIVGWELPGELIQTGDYAGQPFTVSEFYTLSLSEKSKLRPMLESWRGKPFTEDELRGFDLANLLGKPCMIQVGRNKKDRAKVQAVMSLPKGMAVPDQFNESVYFDLSKFDDELFANLSDGIRGLIEKSDEWAARNGTPATPRAAAMQDDDIPF